MKKADGTYTFDKTTKITAPTGIAASASAPITVQTGSDATLNIQATRYGIDAGENSRVTISGNRVSIDTGDVTNRRTIRAAANAVVSISSGYDIKGAIENRGGTVTLDDTGKKSKLDGDIMQSGGTLNLKLQGEGSTLRSDIRARGTVDIDLTGKNAIFTGSLAEMTETPSLLRAARMTAVSADAPSQRSITIGDTSKWNVTGASDVTNLTSKEGGRIAQQTAGAVNVTNFQGKATVFYAGTADKNGTLTLAHNGKFTVKNVQGTGNALLFATDAYSGSEEADKKAALALAQQFAYQGDAVNIADGSVKNLDLGVRIGEGITNSQKDYRMLMGSNGLAKDVFDFQKHKIEYGDYETKLMSGVKSAMTASSMAWRAEANDLMKRMGDLRLSPQDAGVWARVYRGKSTSNKDNANYSMNYSTIQVGYDKKVNDAWRVGIAGSYMKGSSSYANGSGKNKEGNLGIYGTWTGKEGEYVDLIMKIGRLSNDYTVYNDFGHYVKGDFTTWGGSLSAEYGKRILMQGGSYVEPQLELIYSHLNGASYTGDTDYAGMKMYVHQKPFDSFIGRLGIGVGRETERSTCYARVSLYHEFAGNFHSEYSDGSTLKTTQQRGRDTWVGVQLGGTMKLSDRTNLYGSFEKTFGGDIKTNWRMDAGMRWNF